LRISGAVGLITIATCVASITGCAAGPLPSQQAVVREAIADVFGAGTYHLDEVRSNLPDAAAVAEAHADVASRLSAHMTGPALVRWQVALDEAVDAQSDGQHLIAVEGGVDQIRFESATQDRSSWLMTGFAHTWSQWFNPAQQQTGEPDGWSRFEVTVVETPDGWRVSELELTPVEFDWLGNWHEAGG